MGYLKTGMHAGVGAACTHQVDRMVGNAGRGPGKFCLHRTHATLLQLPAMKGLTVVLKDDGNPSITNGVICGEGFESIGAGALARMRAVGGGAALSGDRLGRVRIAGLLDPGAGRRVRAAVASGQPYLGTGPEALVGVVSWNQQLGVPRRPAPSTRVSAAKTAA